MLGDQILTADEQAALSSAAELETYRLGEAAAVQGPFVFLALGFLVLAVLIGVSKLPRILGGNIHDGGMAQVWSNRTLRMGAAAIFVYVGSEVAIGSYMVGYGLELGVDGIIRETPWLASMAGVSCEHQR